MGESDGLQCKSLYLTVCTITKSEVLCMFYSPRTSCSLFLLSHDSSEERAAVRWQQFCWHRSGKLRSITVRTTARVRPTQFCSHHNGKPRSITIRARAQENCCLSTQSQSSSQRTQMLRCARSAGNAIRQASKTSRKSRIDNASGRPRKPRMGRPMRRRNRPSNVGLLRKTLRASQDRSS